ncbi:hypothetical protein HY440_00020 [Candidatus Microgenomates bacterium]|nr:hypothetical protein [Candidatus Microgenomates bacterium]
MKKEYFVVILLILFVLSTVLDVLAGPAKPALRIPFDFLKPTILSVYPLTAVSVIAKTLFITIGLLLGLSLLSGQYLAKGLFLLFFAVISELYSIQQIATSAHVTPLEWTLSAAAVGIVLVLPAGIFILLGAAKNVHQKLTQTVEPPPAT